MADIAGPPESPTGKPDKLGRFKSEEARARSLGNLRPPRRPGDPPLNPHNLGGRPPKDGPASRELRKLLRKKFPGDPVERTYMQLMIEGLVKAAIKGSTLAAALIFERLEGRLPLPVESEMPANITVIVNRNQPRNPEIDQQRLLLEANTSTEKAND